MTKFFIPYFTGSKTQGWEVKELPDGSLIFKYKRLGSDGLWAFGKTIYLPPQIALHFHFEEIDGK